MKNFFFFLLILIIVIFFTACSRQKKEVIPGDGSTVREFLLDRGKILPSEIIKGNSVFSQVTIIYGGSIENHNPKKDEMLWITGNDPDSQICFLFKLKN